MAGPNANLRGVVRSLKNIGGQDYATISLGSADNVQKGMKFNVIGGNKFLGYLTIDSVDYNEATGHLEGPDLKSVRPGSEVATQFQ